ncbi:hypothetical protein JW935_25980 [candidate division KSB1 bacterium]|nr:hypothetical protein [candidate division KSB1 bacterium]
MSKIIIGIHGLGNKPPRNLLKQWWVKSIQSGLAAAGHPVPFRFELVYWADILHPKPLDPNIAEKKHPLFLKEPFSPDTKNVDKRPDKKRQKKLDYIEKQLDRLFLNKDYSINLAGIPNIIIKHFFKDLAIYYSSRHMGGQLVRDVIRQRLLDVLVKYRKKNILLLAHSMGTIISYDVLVNAQEDFTVDTFVTMGSPLGLPIMQNKIAVEQKLKYGTVLSLKTPERVLRHWYNFSDLGDIISLNYNLADDFDPNSKGIHPQDFIINNNYKIQNIRNPHKIYGYLCTSEAGLIFYDFIVRDKNRVMKKLYEWYGRLDMFSRSIWS